MTLFLELINNGNKRRFKYKPNDIHKNCSIIEIKEYLIRRFSHDVDLTKLSISTQCEFEINDSYHKHEFIIFELLTDLFDGSKIRSKIRITTFTLAFALVFAAALPSSSYSTWMEPVPPKLAMEIKSNHDDDGPIMRQCMLHLCAFLIYVQKHFNLFCMIIYS